MRADRLRRALPLLALIAFVGIAAAACVPGGAPVGSDGVTPVNTPLIPALIAAEWGGAVTAAKFLEQFVAGRPWAHLDIAGPSWADSESSTRDAGGTGDRSWCARSARA